MIELAVSTSGIDQIVGAFNATDKQVKQAINSTLRKTGRWLRTRTMRGLSATLKMPQKVLRIRVPVGLRLAQTASGAAVSIWYGLNPVALIHLNARETKKGVSAFGGRLVPGGFIAKRQVFKRVGRSRLPIEVQETDIEAQAVKYLQSTVEGAAFEEQFFKTLESELKWRTQILA